MLMKETRPLRFFGALAGLALAASAILATPVLAEYFTTGLVLKVPTWILAMALLLLAMIMMTAGLVLDSVARGRAEQKRIFYLSIASVEAERRRVPVAAVSPPPRVSRRKAA